MVQPPSVYTGIISAGISTLLSQLQWNHTLPLRKHVERCVIRHALISRHRGIMIASVTKIINVSPVAYHGGSPLCVIH